LCSPRCIQGEHKVRPYKLCHLIANQYQNPKTLFPNFFLKTD
jgi:hypothetical protein